MTTEDTGTQGQEESQDNALIRDLRSQIEKLQKEVKNRPDPENLDAEIQRRIQRRDAARDTLTQLGFPAQMTDLVTANIEDDITEDAVTAYLKGLGFEPGQQDNQEQENKTREVANVASLGSQVASATRKDAGGEDLMSKLGKAQSKAEIDALMQQAGLSD